jgi:predicted Zn-dependent protease with MMP-like domain
MKRETFERLVREAWQSLPAEVLERVENVDVVVEPWAAPEVLQRTGARHPREVLGYYHGVPRTGRTRRYNLRLPDKISIYQQAIELRCVTPAEISALVRHVLLHELAHHFGISDARLREIGAY